jgi:hypothetical protein
MTALPDDLGVAAVDRVGSLTWFFDNSHALRSVQAVDAKTL